MNNQNQIQIEKEKLQDLYKVLTNYPQISKEQVVNEMHKCFGEDVFKPTDIRERVKTFEDACKILGEKNPTVIAYTELLHTATREDFLKDNLGEDVVAFLKLRIVSEALNEGWKPEFTEDEYRYYPWFYIYTKEEYDNLDEDEKKECRVVGRSNNYANANGGLACANTVSASAYSSTVNGSRLAFKNRELAEYCGKQFIDIWEKFLFA